MPSRKIISIFIVAAALVVSIILGFGKNSSISAVREIANTGLLSKGPEVKIPQNKNWLSDLSPLTLNPVEVSSLEASTTPNLTAQVSESLIANYLALRQGGDLNDTSAFELVNQAAAFTESAASSPKTYTTADILVSSDNSQAAIRQYGNDLGNAFKINKPTQVKNELAIFYEIMQTKNRTKIAELKEVASVYKNLTSSLKKIKIPSGYINTHLEMLNNLNKIANSIGDMTMIFEDPLLALQGLGNYKEGYIGSITTMTKILLQILKEDNILYKQGESGYYLYYGI